MAVAISKNGARGLAIAGAALALALTTGVPVSAAPAFTGLEAPFATGVDAAVDLDGGYVWLFSGDRYAVYESAGESVYSVDSLRGLPGWPAHWSRIDAAARWDAATLVLFSGGEWTTYDIGRQTVAPETYPLSSFGLPAGWDAGLDAAVQWGPDALMLFRGGEFLLYEMSAQRAGAPQPLSWQGWPAGWPGTDAVARLAPGTIGFFRGPSFVTYDEDAQRFGPVAGIGRGTAPGGPAPTSTASSDPGWCGAGEPQGTVTAGAVPSESASPIAGGSGGIEFGDRVPPGARVAEVRIRHGWFIDGIQLVVESRDGRRSELPLRGGPGGRMDTVHLDPDECLLGFSGRSLGAAGNYVYTLQVHTSKRSSPVFGGSGAGKGNEAYDLRVPTGGSFTGLTGRSSTFLNALGVRSVEFRASQAAAGAVTAGGPTTTPGAPAAPGAGAASGAGGDAAPTEVGVWAVETDRLGTPMQDPDAEFTYIPQTLLTTRLLPRDSALAIRAGGGSLAGSGPVLVAMTYYPSGPNGEPDRLELAAMAKTGEGRYAGSRGGAEFSTDGVRDRDTMRLGGVYYRRADRKGPENTEMMSASWERSSVPTSLRYVSRAYDLRKLDPWDYTRTGTQRDLFAEVDYYSTDYQVQEGKLIPAGYFYTERADGYGSETCTEIFSAQDYQKALKVGLGFNAGVSTAVGGGEFSLNAGFRSTVKDMSESRTMHCYSTAGCVTHVVQLDKANARIDPAFRREVEALARSGDYRGFIESFGTHYAHAIAYGGRAVKDVRVGEQTYGKIRTTGFDIDMAAKISMGVAKVGEASGGVKASFDQETTRGWRDELKETQNFWRTIGGRSGFGPELWSCDDSKSLPAYLDLRPLYELLTPPAFDDPEIVFGVRERLRAELQRTMHETNGLLLTSRPVFDGKVAIARVEQQLATERRAALERQSAEAAALRCQPKKWRFRDPSKRTSLWVEFSLPAADEGETQQWMEGSFYRNFSVFDCDNMDWTPMTFICAKGEWQQQGAVNFGYTECCCDRNQGQPGLTVGPR